MTDVSWGDHAIFCGPATTLTGPLGIKQVHGTVPIRVDGSVCFEVPPCRMLDFQVLDEHYRAVHTMRSWVSARPGEQRGCTGCHEAHNSTPVVQPASSAWSSSANPNAGAAATPKTPNASIQANSNIPRCPGTA